jgi:Ca2+-binding RTX toxin-like protein
MPAVAPSDAMLAGSADDDEIFGGDAPDTIVGGDGDDLLRGGGGADAIDGGFGSDDIDAGDGDDLVLAGPADDVIDLGAGDDFVDAGSDDDSAIGGGGDDRLRGGPGDDELHGEAGDDGLFGAAGSDVLHGGEGSDDLLGGGGDDELLGGGGDDHLRPGPGKDVARGGAGNDTLHVEAPCEIAAGDILDGGEGEDTLVTSMTVEELAARGVTVDGFETIRIYAPQDGVCDAHDPSLRMIEVTGVAVDAASLWRDRQTQRWFLPDGRDHDAEIWTRTRFVVDGSYDATVTPGTSIFLFDAGGSIDFDDGSGTTVSACGMVPDVDVGFRYRLRLVELRDGAGTIVGFEQEAYVSSTFASGLFFTLPAKGPIPLAVDRSRR